MSEPTYTFLIKVDRDADQVLNSYDEPLKTQMWQAYNDAEVEYYDISCIRDCSEHGWDCRHAEEIAATPTDSAYGLVGAYSSAEEIPDEHLRQVAEDLREGRYP